MQHKRQGQKMSAFTLGEWNSRWGDGGGIREFKSDAASFFFFFFKTHYTGCVASLSKCVPSCSLLLSFKNPPPAKYLSNYFFSLRSDVMNRQWNTGASSRNVQSAFRRILSIIYTVSAGLHETGSNADPLIIVRSGVLISPSPISSAKRN